MVNFRKLHTLLLTILLALAMLCTGAQAESLAGVDLFEMYDRMVALFRFDENYDAALEMINTYGLADAQISDSKLYKIYIEAMNAMDKGDYASAASDFDIVMQQDKAFYNCEVLYYYCSARTAEASADYTLAIELYTLAGTYGDARDRIKTCRQAESEAEAKMADNRYNLGLKLQNTAYLQEALEIYVRLGLTDKETLCLSAIRDIENQADYEAALAQYNEAIASGNVSALQAAAAAFTALGDYSDSAAMLKRINDTLMTITRMVEVTSTTSDAASITVSWSDSQTADASYVLTWGPENAPVAGTITTTEREATLTGLIPRTSYTITITPDSLPDLAVTASAATKTAKRYAENGFTAYSTEIIGANRSAVALKPMAEVLSSTNAFVIPYRSDKHLTLENTYMDFQTLMYLYCFRYTMAQELADPVSIQYVLRTEHSGVYTLGEPLTMELAAALSTDKTGYYGRHYCDLAPLLDQLYEHAGEWPAESCTLEMYINGLLAAQGPLLLQAE